MTPENACAMCGNKPADHGLMCLPCRAEDQAFTDDVCGCATCRSDLARIAPCQNKDQTA